MQMRNKLMIMTLGHEETRAPCHGCIPCQQ